MATSVRTTKLIITISFELPGCEDIIVESLSFDNLVSVLRWSDQPHGSEWVRRQALHFLREEFSVIAASPVLYDLDKVHLVQILQSDFLQVCFVFPESSFQFILSVLIT